MGTEAFAEALDAAMKRRQTNQSRLGRAAGASPAMLSAWLLGRVNQPDPDKVFAVERALELSPGELSRHLGFLPLPQKPATGQPMTFRDWLALHGDKLTDRQRQTLEDTYAEFVEGATAVEGALAVALDVEESGVTELPNPSTPPDPIPLRNNGELREPPDWFTEEQREKWYKVGARSPEALDTWWLKHEEGRAGEEDTG